MLCVFAGVQREFGDTQFAGALLDRLHKFVADAQFLHAWFNAELSEACDVIAVEPGRPSGVRNGGKRDGPNNTAVTFGDETVAFSASGNGDIDGLAARNEVPTAGSQRAVRPVQQRRYMLHVVVGTQWADGDSRERFGSHLHLRTEMGIVQARSRGENKPDRSGKWFFRAAAGIMRLRKAHTNS
jgi:hypothetical protein